MMGKIDFNLDWILGIDNTQPINFLIIAFFLFAGIFLRYFILALVYHELVYKKLGEYQPYRRLHQQIKIRQVEKGGLAFFFGGSYICRLRYSLVDFLATGIYQIAHRD